MKNETQVQHTPGPWETGAGPSDRDLYVCEPEGGDLIAEVVNGSVADRNLIAAAPDLLSACKAVYHQLEYGEASDTDAPDVKWCAKALREAVAKAEGGAL